MIFQVIYSCIILLYRNNFDFIYIVIQAFEPVLLDKYNYPVVDLTTMSTSEPGVFCGGDLAKIASTTVESVNDGKTAAWHMHRFIQV
jgi:dihydropyrimidine dehydrogenase (NADP+)